MIAGLKVTAKEEKSKIRKFGLTFAALFFAAGVAAFYLNKGHYRLYLTLSALLITACTAFPVVLKPVYKVWMALAEGMSWLMTRVLLVTFFFLIITPLHYISKALKKQFLDFEIDRLADSYWIPRKRRLLEKKTYERQF